MLVTIFDSNGSAVIDSIGAQLISYKDSTGKETIWQRDPKFWNRCSPLLFPIVGNCRNNKTIIEGKSYCIEKHGFCRDVDFQVTRQSDTAVTFEIHDTEETKAVYPYSFSLSLTYVMENGMLSMEYRVANTDDRTIYYCIGAHPGFNCPMEEGASFNDYELVFEEDETVSSMVYDLENLQFDPSHRIPRLDHSRRLPLTREMFKDDAVYFDDLKSRKVSIIHKDSSHGIEVGFPGFDTVAFWTPYPAEAPFLCVEPWNGSGVYATEDDEFVHKNHVQKLEAGKSKTYGLTIRMI